MQLAGGIGSGCAANVSLAFPAKGAPFITSRLADQVWNQLSPPATVYFRVDATGARPHGYQWKRIQAWLHPDDYALTEGYQTARSVRSIGSGRLRVGSGTRPSNWASSQVVTR